jgi:energy-converting hydrogenase Eha subunit B
MIQKFKRSIVISLASIALMVPGLVPGLTAVVVADSITTNLCTGTTDATGGTATCTASDPDAAIKKLAALVIDIFSIVVGVIAVVMVIYGGFRYITSGGDSGKVSSAKNTLIFALIGLFIVALAQFLVHFVLTTANNANLT